MSSDGKHRLLKVFISSTYEDLKAYIDTAKEVLRKENFEFYHFKDWEATGRPSVSECKERVNASDALVVIVGQIYGWIPSIGEGGDGITSITRLEVRWAREKPMPVLPFIIEQPGGLQGDSIPGDTERSRIANFVAELKKGLFKPVNSPERFLISLRDSLRPLVQKSDGLHPIIPTQVGERTQGKYLKFRGRTKARDTLSITLAANKFRGASIVGKGGFGKSALANDVIDNLKRKNKIDIVIYLSSSPKSPINAFDLFMATMEASGKSKIDYEGSWNWLKSNEKSLIEVLLGVFKKHRILLLFDGFEHNLGKGGKIRMPQIRAFVKAFILSSHPSKLLLTTREPPILSPDETKFIREIHLSSGLSTSDGISLLMGLLPDGSCPSEERLEVLVKAVNGIPFLIERMTELVQKDRLLDLNTSMVLDDTYNEFVKLAHSTLSPEARLTIQARAVFDDPVSPGALKYVLEPKLKRAEVESAIKELGRGNFFFRVGSGDLLGIHELDHESSYRNIERDGILDRKLLHSRAADFFAGSCEERKHWFEWTSYDDLTNDIKRFNQLIRAGKPVAATNALSISKVEFMNWSGHVDQIRQMFMNIDVGEAQSHALLVKHYALADSLVVVGPFKKAIRKLTDVVRLARSLGNEQAEISALYELGIAYRYAGNSKKAVNKIREGMNRIRNMGESEWLAYYLYGYSIACTYSGEYIAAIQSGIEQVHYGHRTAESYFVGRGNSSLCIPYYMIGMTQEAVTCAEKSSTEFRHTSHEHMVGFIKNVLGLALYEQGNVIDSIAAFDQARSIGKQTAQRRVEGLVATNWAWVQYEQGDPKGAIPLIHDAISIFKEISEADLCLANHLREAFEYACEGDRMYETEALCEFVLSDYVNPDLVRGVTVAKHILSDCGKLTPTTRQRVESFINNKLSFLKEITLELQKVVLEQSEERD